MEKKTSDVSLSFCHGVFAVWRSRSSSRIRSRYQDFGDCRARPNMPYQRFRSRNLIERISAVDSPIVAYAMRKFALSVLGSQIEGGWKRRTGFWKGLDKHKTAIHTTKSCTGHRRKFPVVASAMIQLVIRGYCVPCSVDNIYMRFCCLYFR
jgi:hypothetical protein